LAVFFGPFFVSLCLLIATDPLLLSRLPALLHFVDVLEVVVTVTVGKTMVGRVTAALGIALGLALAVVETRLQVLVQGGGKHRQPDREMPPRRRELLRLRLRRLRRGQVWLVLPRIITTTACRPFH